MAQHKNGKLLTGHANEKYNICNDCGGPLRDESGVSYSRLVDHGKIAYAAAICRGCKEKDNGTLLSS